MSKAERSPKPDPENISETESTIETLSRAFLDHLVVTAPTLESGAAFVRRVLGVSPQPGGEYARMGTHHLLLSLGENCYLEVLAPNPNAPKPPRPRWFGLDSLTPTSPPRLTTWVARTVGIHAALSACSPAWGEIELMSRGDFEWLITIPPDGGLPFEGVAPTLIEWRTAVHPASRLASSGCSLTTLLGFHPRAAEISDSLRAVGFHGPVIVREPPADEGATLSAVIETPDGPRVL